jgi:hypothetical protein
VKGIDLGFVKDKLKKRGWSKSKLELVDMAVSWAFLILLLYAMLATGILEGKCRAMLANGETIGYSLDNPPNFSEQLVMINIDNESNCSYQMVCKETLICHYPEHNDACWTEPFC